jgi:hypothetical protein
VLLGFQFRAILETGFEKVPEHAKYMKLGVLGLLLLAVALLIFYGLWFGFTLYRRQTRGQGVRLRLQAGVSSIPR